MVMFWKKKDNLKSLKKENDRLKKDIDHVRKDLNKAIRNAKAGKEFNLSKKTLDIGNVPNMYNHLKAHRKPGSTWLINMQMRTGYWSTFLITTDKPDFRHLGGLYTIDETAKYYNTTCKMFCLDYHQDLPLPIKRCIDVDSIKTAIESSSMLTIDNALNPQALNRWEESSIIQKLLAGSGIDELLKQIKLIAAVGAISGVILLIMWLYQTGFFDSLPMIG